MLIIKDILERDYQQKPKHATLELCRRFLSKYIAMNGILFLKRHQLHNGTLANIQNAKNPNMDILKQFLPAV